MDSKRTALAVLLASVTGVQAQYGGYGGYGPFGGDGSGSGSGFGSNSGNGFGFGGFQGSAGFDIDAATRARAIHGILGALAMVILFPIGSIFMRVIPGRLALWAHGLAQLVAYTVYLACVGLGIYLVRSIEIPFGGGSLMTNPNTSYHPVIGLVVLVFLFFQPFLGIIHHAKFKKVQRRQVWSYLHIFNGRIFITLGIANGGLGLWMAGASDNLKTAYIAVAVVMWVLWMLSAAWGEWRRWRASRQAQPGVPGRKMSDGNPAF